MSGKERAQAGWFPAGSQELQHVCGSVCGCVCMCVGIHLNTCNFLALVFKKMLCEYDHEGYNNMKRYHGVAP